MTYTFSGQTTNTPSAGSTSATVSLSIGAAANPWVAVAVQAGTGITGTSTLTVGGVSMTLATNDTDGVTYLYYGHITGGLSGSQNVVWSSSSVGASTIGFALWYTSDTLGALTAVTNNGGSNNQNISVTSGQYMFGLGASPSGSQTWLATETPQEHDITGTSENGAALDWKIISTSTSFNVNNNGGSFVFISLEAFTVTPAAATWSMLDKSDDAVNELQNWGKVYETVAY